MSPLLSLRMRNTGGRVKDVHGTHRVYLALDDVPGLAMSRSLGDYVAHSAGIIWPTVHACSLHLINVYFHGH